MTMSTTRGPQRDALGTGPLEPRLVVADDQSPTPGEGSARRRWRWKWLRPEKGALIWLGIACAAAGFTLIFVAWGMIAGETQVYFQIPYLVSAGFTGLALVMVGLTAVNVAAARHDSSERMRQTDQLVAILTEVSAALAEREAGD